MTITALALAAIITVATLFGLGLGLAIATLYFWQKDPEKVSFPAKDLPPKNNCIAFSSRERPVEEDLFGHYRDAVLRHNEASGTKARYVFTSEAAGCLMYVAADRIPLMVSYPPRFRCHEVIYKGENFSFYPAALPTS